MKAKLSFDARGLAAAVLQGSFAALRRAGAYVRRAARHKVKTSDHPSPPGSPPHSRAGLLKRSILFGLDKPARTVVIGRAESVIGNAMAAHEFGGRYKRERFKGKVKEPSRLSDERNSSPVLVLSGAFADKENAAGVPAAPSDHDIVSRVAKTAGPAFLRIGFKFFPVHNKLR